MPVPEKARNKLSANFEPDPYVIVEKTGSDVTCRSSAGRELRRNSSCFKRLEVAEDELGRGDLLSDSIVLSEVGLEPNDSDVQPPVPVVSRPKHDCKVPTKFKDYVPVRG